MKKTGKFLLCVLSISTVFASFAHAQITVIAQIGSPQVYLGQRFIYQITLDGTDHADGIDISPLAQWSPQGGSGQNQSSSFVSIVNGRQTKREEKKYIVSYSLLSFAEGTFTLPAITVEIDGQKFRTNPIDVIVITPDKTDKMQIEVQLSDQKCYIGQPITVTINWYIWANVKEFFIAGDLFTQESFLYEDLPGKPANGKSSITIGNIQLPMRQGKITKNGSEAILVSMQKVIIPQASGNLNFQPLSVTADLAVAEKKRSRRDSFFNRDQYEYQKFIANSKPITLTVKPLPTENQPTDFTGLIGRYTISASADTDSKTHDGKLAAAIGDPITLTAKISGNYLSPAQSPNLNAITDFAQNFKIPPQQSSPTTQGNSKIFVQTIRPENDNITQIPQIPLTYFDPDKGDYTTIYTDPIPIEVTAAIKLTTDDMIGNSSTASRELERIKQGLSANYQALDALQDYNFNIKKMLLAPTYLLLWAIPLAVLILATIYKLLTSTTQQQQIAKQKNAACKKSLAILSAAKPNDHTAITLALKTFIGQRYNLNIGSLTAADCHELILKATADKDLAQQYKDILATCEAAIYSPSATQTETDKKHIAQLIKTIDKKSKK